MVICDRCKCSGKDLRNVRMGCWYEKITQGDGLTEYWTERRGQALEMALCPPCFNTLSKKIVATVEQDQVQPAYSLRPRGWWIRVGVPLAMVIGGLTYFAAGVYAFVAFVRAMLMHH